MSRKQVIVSQQHNPRYDHSQPSAHPQYGYRVEKTVNTLRVTLGQILTPGEVQDLIDNGYEVSVTTSKR